MKEISLKHKFKIIYLHITKPFMIQELTAYSKKIMNIIYW